MPDTLTRSYEARITDTQPAKRAVVAVINTGDVDRFSTSILPSGAILENYRKNPVVLWEHGKTPQRGLLPVGKNLWIKSDKGNDRLIAKTQFAEDEFSDGLWQLYRDGILSGFSINALPRSYSAPTAGELRSRPDLSKCKTVYRSWELAEYSAVAVPGNARCLVEAVERGLWLPDTALEVARSLMPAEPAPSPEPEVIVIPTKTTPDLPALVGRTMEQVRRSIRESVRREYDPERVARDLFEMIKGRV